jgi:hypothetical protein
VIDTLPRQMPGCLGISEAAEHGRDAYLDQRDISSRCYNAWPACTRRLKVQRMRDPAICVTPEGECNTPTSKRCVRPTSQKVGTWKMGHEG